MTKPNFYTVGFPKCGTVSLSYYLSEHSVFLVSTIKEPHFFATVLPKLRVYYISDEAAYLALPESAGRHYRAVGEASVSYICSAVATEKDLPVCREAEVYSDRRESNQSCTVSACLNAEAGI